MNLTQELENFCTHQAEACNAFEAMVIAMRSTNVPLSEAHITYAMRMQFEYLYQRDALAAARDKLTLEDLQAIASMESLLTGESFEVDLRFRKQ